MQNKMFVECFLLSTYDTFEGLWPSERETKRACKVSLDARNSENYFASHLLPRGGWSVLHLRLLSGEYGFWAPGRPLPRLRYAAAERPRADSRAGARRQRRSESGLCSLAPRCPRVVSPPWPFLPSRPSSGSPLPLLQALSNPCPGQSRRAPYPLTLRCIMPERSPQGCETQRSCPWAGTGGDRAGRRGGEGAAGTVHRPGPGESPGSRPPAPRGPTARPSRRSLRRPPPPQPWRKFIDVSMPGLKEKPPRNPPHTDMRRSWGWRRPKRWRCSWSCWPPAFTAWAPSWSWWSTRACSPTTGRAEAAAAAAAEAGGGARGGGGRAPAPWTCAAKVKAEQSWAGAGEGGRWMSGRGCGVGSARGPGCGFQLRARSSGPPRARFDPGGKAPIEPRSGNLCPSERWSGVASWLLALEHARLGAERGMPSLPRSLARGPGLQGSLRSLTASGEVRIKLI